MSHAEAEAVQVWEAAIDEARAEAKYRNIARKSWLRKHTALRAHPHTRAQAAQIEPRLLEAVTRYRAAVAHLESLQDEDTPPN